MTIFEYFNSALAMDNGDTLLIPCENEREQETVRTRLMYLRRQARGEALFIAKEKKDNQLFISIKKIEIRRAFILKASGELVDVKDKEIATELERIVKLSIQDKVPLEELIDGFGSIFDPDKITEEYNRQKAELE